MVANEAFWLALSRRARLLELDRGESLELLASKNVGRLGFVNEGGPQILPMNYILVGDDLIIRTAAYGVAARGALHQLVAFEVDEVDGLLHAGWSVLVVGPAGLLSDIQLQQLRLGTAPQPWPEGARTLFLSIACKQVSGRRLRPA